MKEAHLSDGAVAALREDLAEAKARVPMVLAWGYVSKALDEVEWLRSRELELENRAETAEARVAELEAQIEKRSKSALACGFCGKAQKEVTKLIAGPQCYICNECVSVCATLIPLGELIRPLIANTTEVSLTASEIVMFIDKLGADQRGEGVS